MAPDLNSIATAGASSATSSGHQHAQNNYLSTSQQQPTSRNSTSRSTSNRSSPNHSRRTSQLSSMNPPPLPLGHANSSAPQHQSQQTYAPFPPLSPHMSASGPAPNGRARTVSGAGAEIEAGVPMRHPRPLTAAELHHELELEQEAVVNRLTRELSALRAHSASVASTTSVSSMSTSTSLQSSHPHVHPHGAPVAAGTPFPLFEATGDPMSTGAAHHVGALTGPTHPSGTASRRDRSSSSVSRSGGVPTSAPTLSHSVGGGAGATAPGVGLGVYGHGGQHRYSISSPGGSSTSNSNNANATATTTGSSSGMLDGSSGSSTYAGGVALARSPSLGVQGGNGAAPGGHVSRFEETALHRQELEEAKRENETLRKRIRELEVELRGRRRVSSSAAGRATSANGTVAAAGERPSVERSTSSRQSEADATGSSTAVAAASADGS